MVSATQRMVAWYVLALLGCVVLSLCIHNPMGTGTEEHCTTTWIFHVAACYMQMLVSALSHQLLLQMFVFTG
jgi:hypothetical protein